MKTFNKITAVLVCALMLFGLAAPAAAQETVRTGEVKENTAIESGLPALPEGYEFTGEIYTDDETGDYYLLTGPVSENGCADTCWVNSDGEIVGRGLTPFSEPTDMKDDPDYLPEAPAGAGSRKKAPGRSSAAVLPSSYDARNDGLLTPVRDQVGGTCWAHASIAAVEANAIKNGIATADTIRLSEYHAAWYCKNGYYEGITDSDNDGLVSPSLDLILSEGGSAPMMKRALTNFAGPASRDHYGMASNKTDLLGIMEQEFTWENRSDRELVVTDLVEIANDRAAIKNAVLKYGALYCRFTENSSLFTNGHPSTYYSAGRNGEYHAVAIVGWDDSFSRNNFTASSGKPPADGAWLMRNSWGTGSHDNGYFWMTYDEPTLENIYAFVTASSEEFPNVYCYDGSDVSAERTASAAANIFTAEGNEYLTKVSHGEKTDEYSFSVYGYLPANCADPTEGTLLYTQSGNAGGVRYIDVEGPVSLQEGERFAVVFSDISKAYTETASTDTSRFTGHIGESFIYTDGSWQDTEALGYHNVCIRAITKNTVYSPDYRVKFACPGQYSEIAYAHNGTVDLPSKAGYTYVLTYNGAPFDGTGVDRDITVNMHCYPTAGKVNENNPCERVWECEYCGRQFREPQVEHSYSPAVVAPSPVQPGYTEYTCSGCGDAYYEDFVGYDGAPGGIAGNCVWQLYDNVFAVDGEGSTPDYPLATSAPWYSLRSQVKTLYLHDGITAIGEFNFYSFTEMDNIRWSENLDTIGKYAFNNCHSLTVLELPDSLRTIKERAFYSCHGITDIVFNDDISYIRPGAFTLCHGLTDVVYPATLGICDTGIYTNCKNIRRVVIEEGITSILYSPVYYNTPNIGVPAEIEEIVIPSTVMGISELLSDTGFYSGPQKYTVSPDNRNYTDVDGVLFTKDMKRLVLYPSYKHGVYYAVPDTVEKVLPRSFKDNRYLRFLDLSNMIGTWVRDYTCLWMKSIENINLQPRTSAMFYQALGTTNKVEKIFIPSTTTYFEQNSLDPASIGTIYTDRADTALTAYAESVGIPCVVLENHVHSYDTREYVEQTDCSNPGFAIDVCVCGQFRYTELPADHTPGNPTETVIRAATCKETGEKVTAVKCVTCGITLSENRTTIPVDSANHTGNNVITGAVEAACSRTGYTGDTVCADCGAVLSSGQSTAKNPNNHLNTEQRAAVPSTCVSHGYTAGVYCLDCGRYVSGHSELPLAAHRTVTVNKKAATCTENGYTGDLFCTVCEQTVSRGSSVNSLGHASPDGSGNCTRCGEHIKDVGGDNGGSGQDSGSQQTGDCKYCGGTHTGAFGWLVRIIHSILALFGLRKK